jgi:hypothetical protein
MQRRLVSSHRGRLDPFSQNSKGWMLGRLAHEQETHMKPCGLVCRASVSIAIGDDNSLPKTRLMLPSDP